MHLAIVIALLLLVGGCADSLGLPSPEASKTISGARSVGVISAVGHKFAVQKIGITVFGNELNEATIDVWGIDDAVAIVISGSDRERNRRWRLGYVPDEALTKLR